MYKTRSTFRNRTVLISTLACDKVECEGLDTHAHFRNFGYSVLTLFRVSTGDNWNGILKVTLICFSVCHKVTEGISKFSP